MHSSRKNSASKRSILSLATRATTWLQSHSAPGGRNEISEKLRLCSDTYQAIEYGSAKPERIGILTGSGQSAVPHLLANGIDTLITGELRQHHFNMAQELGLNLYPCGHYATEVFGVKASPQRSPASSISSGNSSNSPARSDPIK